MVMTGQLILIYSVFNKGYMHTVRLAIRSNTIHILHSLMDSLSFDNIHGELTTFPGTSVRVGINKCMGESFQDYS